MSHVNFKTAISVGSVKTTRSDLSKRILKIMNDNPAAQYDVLTNNCNHFAARMCKDLGVDAPPDWINKLAEKSASVADAFGAVSDAITKVLAPPTQKRSLEDPSDASKTTQTQSADPNATSL
mmetsp:Transcript_108640/g.198128  ORF Transcript_108640/g.198128 Transcript_108640/m.198128 type:complete len:122 (+) Transcript_108640:3-368(+)